MLQTMSLYVALAIFGLGLIYKGSTWFRHSIGFDAKNIGAGKRVASAARGILAAVFGTGAITLLKTFFGDVLLQLKLYRHDRLRWFAHMCVFAGFTMLFLMHAMARFTAAALFPSYLPTLNPFLFLRDLFGAMVLVGLAISTYRRIFQESQNPPTTSRDIYAIVIVALIVFSGVWLEGAKVTSYSAYQEMVEAYAGGEDEATLQALEAYWVETFGVASPHVKGPFDAATLAAGRDLHRASCGACHAQARWGFMGYGAAKAMAPLALAADRINLRTILLYVHFLACCLGLALLPFSKMLHIFTSPLSLLANAVMTKGQADPANVATRQVLELDACTHCGMCTARCAVAFAFEEIPNVNILPSEKIASLKRLASGKDLNDTTLGTIQQGLFLCTNCYRCTSVCPVGINLQELWFNVREGLLAKNLPEFLMLSPFSLYRGLMQQNHNHVDYQEPLDRTRQAVAEACDMETVENRALPLEPGHNGLAGAVSTPPQSGTSYTCYRCMTCSSVCPVVRSYPNPMERLGLLPHQIMHATGLKLWDLIFSSRMLWDCLSCYQCQEHCPMSVRTADIILELKNLAIARAMEQSLRAVEEKP
jgi:heterodisulfide reductase subunit C/nitrate reductase gamma subunit